jgi:hypothetical protein
MALLKILSLCRKLLATRSSDDLDDPLGNAERVLDTLRVKLSLFSSSIPFCHSPECHHHPSGEFIKILLQTFMNTYLTICILKKNCEKKNCPPIGKKPDRLSIVSRQRPGVFLTFQKLSKQQQILKPLEVLREIVPLRAGVIAKLLHQIPLSNVLLVDLILVSDFAKMYCTNTCHLRPLPAPLPSWSHSSWACQARKNART